MMSISSCPARASSPTAMINNKVLKSLLGRSSSPGEEECEFKERNVTIALAVEDVVVPFGRQ